MDRNINIFESSEENVWKYVFETDTEVIEAVLYRYQDFYKRTVICCSVMSGCPVGCIFCGTGKKFIRNLKANEIVDQIKFILDNKGIKDIVEKGERFQIMFMSMGEPMLNWEAVKESIEVLQNLYPNAELLLSTIGVNDNKVFNSIIQLSKKIHKIGLQFSIHKSMDAERNELIPFTNKWTLQQIRDAGLIWWRETNRKPYLNYCIDGTNNTIADLERLTSLFSPIVFNITFSVVCSKDETVKDAGYRNLEKISQFSNDFIERGYNTRIFDPAGQDDIGGGCGMLWYVQEWLKKHDKL